MTIDEIRELMKEPRIRLSVALHEAGHVVYARPAGAIGEHYYRLIEHSDRPGEFGGGGVRFTFNGNIELQAMARYDCAGGALARDIEKKFRGAINRSSR